MASERTQPADVRLLEAIFNVTLSNPDGEGEAVLGRSLTAPAAGGVASPAAASPSLSPSPSPLPSQQVHGSPASSSAYLNSSYGSSNGGGGGGMSFASTSSWGGRQPPEPPTRLAELAQELALEEGEPRSAASLADGIVFARMQAGGADGAAPDVLRLLADAYRRAGLEGRRPAMLEGQRELVQKCRALCVNYIGLALQMPEVVPQPEGVTARGALHLLDSLLADAAPSEFGGRDSESLPSGLLTQLVEDCAADEDRLGDIFGPILAELALKLRAETVLDDFMAPLQVMRTLVAYKTLAKLAVGLPEWMPPGTPTGKQMETQTLMGAVLGLSAVLTDEVSRERAFPDVEDPREIEHGISMLQSPMEQINSTQTEIIKSFMVADTRQQMLSWLGEALNSNADKGKYAHKMRLVTSTATASDGFLLNLCELLMRLCVPFYHPASPNVRKIDPAFSLSPHRLCGQEDVPRLAMTEEQFKRAQGQHSKDGKQVGASAGKTRRVVVTTDSGEVSLPPNFGTISEFFFMGAHSVRLGALSAMESWHDDQRVVRQTEKHLRDMRAHQGGGQHFQRQLERVESEYSTSKRKMLCLQAYLTRSGFLQHLVGFVRLLAAWLRQLACGGGNMLPEEPSLIFAAQPDTLIEIVLEAVLFVLNVMPDLWSSLDDVDSVGDIYSFFVTFTPAENFVANPNHRAKMIEVLARLFANERMPHEIQMHLLRPRDEQAAQLGVGLLRFYADVEFGTDNAYYQKFTTRTHIANILRRMWGVQEHRAALIAAADTPAFLRFVNMMINDSIHCMDEGIELLVKIKQTQAAMQDEQRWSENPERAQAEQQHQHDEGVCKYSFSCVSEIIEMLQYLSSYDGVLSPFMRPEIKDRLAAMLNHFLDTLNGPKCATLKVEDPQKYRFDAKSLLVSLTDVYRNLSRPHAGGNAEQLQDFAAAVSRDQRCFKVKNFETATRALRRFALRDEMEIAEFERMAALAVEAQREAENVEEQLGEIPEEMLDPITMELMQDPVTLPSGNVMDRKNIAQHLLSDERDPFNRQKLTLDMLVPNDELRVAIERFKTATISGEPMAE